MCLDKRTAVQKALKLVFIFAIVLSSSLPATAAIEAVEFNNDESTRRYHSLIAELRCLVCQNQNLADSNAELAKDLRRKTAQMIKSGSSDDEILNYMRERYGDFVLYRPPFNYGTIALWVGPFILLIFAVFFLAKRIRSRQENALVSADFEESQAQQEKVKKVRALLDQSSSLNEKEKPTDPIKR